MSPTKRRLWVPQTPIASTRYYYGAAAALSVALFYHGMWPRVTLLTSCWCAKNLIASIRIGITRRLGIPLFNGAGRRLGLLERWYVSQSRAGHHTGFILALELQQATSGMQDVAVRRQLEDALARVARRFPWLRARVGRDGLSGGVDRRDALTPFKGGHGTSQSLWGDDLFVKVASSGSLKEHVTIREVLLPGTDEPGTAGGLSKIMEEEGRKGWHDEDPSECLWRAVLVKWEGRENEFAVVLSFHHLIVDGVGAVSVVRALLEEVGQMDENTCQSHDDTELPPPMEDLVDTVPRIGHLVMPVLLDRFPKLTPYLRPSHWQGLPHNAGVKPGERTSVMVLLGLEDDAVTQLRQVCRKRNITVNGACVAAFCRAVSMHVREHPELFPRSGVLDDGRVRLKLQVAIDERTVCSVEPKELGCYLFGPQVTVLAGPKDDCVALGRSFNQSLQATIPSSRMDMGLCRFISEDWIAFCRKFEAEEPNGRGDSIEVSNLGAISFGIKEENSWKVKGLWFAQGRNFSGPAIKASLVTGPRGLKVVLSAVPQAVTRNSLLSIGECWRSEMLMMAQQL